MNRSSMTHDGDLGVFCKKYYVCTYLLQADSLYMGIPTGGVCSLLRLLLLQCDVVGSTDAPHLLGCSNITNVLQVYLQQGVCFYICSCEGKKCMKTMRTLQVTYIFGSPSFSSSSLWLIFILQLEGDDRSDEEEDDTDSPKEKQHKLSHINGSGIRGRASGHWHMQTDRNREKGKGTADTWTDYIWIAAVRI